MAFEEKERMLHEERGKQYGEGTFAHNNLGLIWTGLIQNHYGVKLPHPLPPDLVLLMFAASKANRAACPTKLHNDNYDDGKVYFEMARKAKGDFDGKAQAKAGSEPRPYRAGED